MGSSAMTPVTCPVGSTPASGLPSTSAALMSMGALAAMATCAQVRSWWRFMATPSRTRSGSGVPGDLAEPEGGPQRPRQAGEGRRPFEAVDGGVRMTRWGAPSRAVVTTVSVTAAAEVAGLDVVGHVALGGQQEPGPHGHPVGAPGQRGDQAAAVVEPARPQHRYGVADGVDHLGQQQRGGHGAGVAAALAALGDDGVDAEVEHLLGVAAGARPSA